MSWYKQSLRVTEPVEYAQQVMEDNREDVEYLVAVLKRYEEIKQDLDLISLMIDSTTTEDATDVIKMEGEMEQLKTVWNNYSETLRNFALFQVHNEEL
jgi:hypothetical protein